MDEQRKTVLEKIRAARDFVLPVHRLMVDLDPNIAQCYETFSALAMRGEGESPLDRKTLALIGIGVTTAVRNDREGIEQCIVRARKAGASDREIMAAIMVAALPAGIPAVEYAATVWYEMKQGKTYIEFTERLPEV